MLSEAARIFLSGIILFYAVMNLGFLSPYQSQVNPSVLENMFYKISEQQKFIRKAKFCGTNKRGHKRRSLYSKFRTGY